MGFDWTCWEDSPRPCRNYARMMYLHLNIWFTTNTPPAKQVSLLNFTSTDCLFPCRKSSQQTRAVMTYFTHRNTEQNCELTWVIHEIQANCTLFRLDHWSRPVYRHINVKRIEMSHSQHERPCPGWTHNCAPTVGHRGRGQDAPHHKDKLPKVSKFTGLSVF